MNLRVCVFCLVAVFIAVIICLVIQISAKHLKEFVLVPSKSLTAFI